MIKSPFLICVINLDRAVGRLEYISSQLSAQDLQFQRLSGVDGSKLGASELSQLQRQYKYSYHYSALSAGEVGCSLSWHNVWGLVGQSKSKATVVLEDDVKIADNFQSIVTSLFKSIDENIIIDLSGKKGFIEKDRRVVNGVTIIRYSSPPLGNQGAIYGRMAAKKLLENVAEFSAPCDNLRQMKWLHGVQTWSLEEGCVSHQTREVGGSNIGHSKRKWPRKLREELLRPWYRGKNKIQNLIYGLKG